MIDRQRDLLARLLLVAALLVVAAALFQELRRPPAARRWHGKVFGFIPYDFRPPTLERLRRAYWDPANPSLFTSHVLGVGWSVNLPALVRTVRTSGIFRRP
jgi:hypothetical protein